MNFDKWTPQLIILGGTLFLCLVLRALGFNGVIEWIMTVIVAFFLGLILPSPPQKPNGQSNPS